MCYLILKKPFPNRFNRENLICLSYVYCYINKMNDAIVICICPSSVVFRKILRCFWPYWFIILLLMLSIFAKYSQTPVVLLPLNLSRDCCNLYERWAKIARQVVVLLKCFLFIKMTFIAVAKNQVEPFRNWKNVFCFRDAASVFWNKIRWKVFRKLNWNFYY